MSETSCEPGDCLVCLAAHSTGMHFAQNSANTASNSEDDASAANNSGGSLRDHSYSLVFKPTSQLKIFLSYGHDRYQQVALHLKHALQQRGHTVWVDIEKLAAGIDWEEVINGALTWVKEAQQDGRVLLLMTPHALRRPDGYCLNEIARAGQNHLSIFPVMVAESEPPPSISMLPFFDLRECVPTSAEHLALDANSHAWLDLMRDHVHSAAFESKCQRLFAMLELFDSMNAYGVPAVAGVENLGLFASSFDTTHPLHLRGSSLRRLLAQTSFDSMRSLDLGPASPVAHDDGSAADSIGSSRSGETAVIGVTAGGGAGEIKNTAALQTRFMFSFDNSCYVLAKQLHDDLVALGFAVFAPPPPPPPGASLESLDANAAAHEAALQWAAAEKNGKMILLVTPESVGRPKGECLNDISAAMAAGIGFVPLMVRQCEIPLSICRIQWLDMSDSLLYAPSGSARRLVDSVSINMVRYSIRLEQLATALKGKLDHEGQQARLASILSPLSFQQQISKLTSRFAGREWLFERLEHWIASPSASQVFWVAGPIGSGKTALAARMVQLIPEIKAFHFALQDDEQTQHSRRCVLSLAYQLTTQLPQYAAFLQSREPLEEVVPVSNFNTLVTHLLVEPLNEIARPQSAKPLVLLIDGLEHLAADKSGHGMAAAPSMARPSFGRASGSGFGGYGGTDAGESLVSALSSLVARLPEWVRIVLLSRKDPAITAKLQGHTPSIVLDMCVRENEADIRSYIEKTLGAPRAANAAVATMVAASPLLGADSAPAPPKFLRNRSPSVSVMPLSDTTQASASASKLSPEQVDLIVKRSEGLFLYAVNIVQAIEEKRLAVDELASLPIGMGGYFRQFFDSHFDELVYKDSIRPVLEILCAAFEPLSLAIVASILRWSVYEQQEIASSFGSLLFVGADGNLRPFHSSVLDWVQDLATADAFFVDVANGHERIGLWAAREYDAIVHANRNDFVNLDFGLEASRDLQHVPPSEVLQSRTRVYIVRHMCNHLTQARGDECIKLVGKYVADDKFQLARRLSSLRSEGLESFFHGAIERDESQLLLQRNPRVGSFLIRYSSKKKCYCASFIKRMDPGGPNGAMVPRFAHNLIHHLPSGAYSIVPPAEVTDTTPVYPDLVSFVEVYQKKGILQTAISRDSPLNRQISLSPDV